MQVTLQRKTQVLSAAEGSGEVSKPHTQVSTPHIHSDFLQLVETEVCRKVLDITNDMLIFSLV